MAKCTAEKRAQCASEGKVCNPQTGRCKIAEKDKKKKQPAAAKKAGGGKGKGKKVSDSMVAAAVIANVGTETGFSLMRGKSKKLGAGMGTMIQETKKKLRATSSKKKTAADGGCDKKICTRKRPVLHGCRCYTEGSAALRKKGVCTPKVSPKTGKLQHYVHVYSKGAHRCVKAGGATAKELLGEAGCPPGKILSTATRRVPTPDGRMVQRQTSRCVFPRGGYAEFKECHVGKVLVQMPDYSYRCLLPKTAAAQGYKVLKQGVVPKPGFTVQSPSDILLAKRLRGTVPAMSVGPAKKKKATKKTGGKKKAGGKRSRK